MLWYYFATSQILYVWKNQAIFICFLYENELDEQHIANRSRDDAKQGIPLPDVEQNYNGRRDERGQKAAERGKARVLEAIHDKHSHDRVGEHRGELFDDLRGFSAVAEKREGQKSERGGDERNDRDREPDVSVFSHFACPPFPFSFPCISKGVAR